VCDCGLRPGCEWSDEAELMRLVVGEDNTVFGRGLKAAPSLKDSRVLDPREREHGP
jgi:hypothetical protein